MSAACESVPRVVAEGYDAKGKWIELGGLKTYVTGPETATKALVDVYDIFGPASQTLQGADGMAKALGALVILPDFFEGSPAQDEWFTNPTPETDAKKQAFFARAMGDSFDGNVKRLLAITAAAKEKWGAVESWGVFGLCWGGKLAALASGPESPFKASGQVHPGRLATEDARKISIPHICLASKDEDAAVVKEYAEVLMGDGKPHVVETYATMHHGWMGARAKLNDTENAKEYLRGYNQLAQFFAKHL